VGDYEKNFKNKFIISLVEPLGKERGWFELSETQNIKIVLNKL